MEPRGQPGPDPNARSRDRLAANQRRQVDEAQEKFRRADKLYHYMENKFEEKRTARGRDHENLKAAKDRMLVARAALSEAEIMLSAHSLVAMNRHGTSAIAMTQTVAISGNFMPEIATDRKMSLERWWGIFGAILTATAREMYFYPLLLEEIADCCDSLSNDQTRFARVRLIACSTTRIFGVAIDCFRLMIRNRLDRELDDISHAILHMIRQLPKL